MADTWVNPWSCRRSNTPKKEPNMKASTRKIPKTEYECPGCHYIGSTKNAMSVTPPALPPRKALIPAKARNFKRAAAAAPQAWSKFLVYCGVVEVPRVLACN